MNFVRVQAVLREGGHSHKNSKLVLLCAINVNRQLEDGEWTGYIKNELVRWPFILENGKSCSYGGEEHYFEPTNLGLGPIEVGRFFTISSPPGEANVWESTYEITSCHVYHGKVEIIEQEVSQLTLPELASFRSWFASFDAAAWDVQIENDAESGKLNSLAEKALKSFKSGQSTEF